MFLKAVYLVFLAFSVNAVPLQHGNEDLRDGDPRMLSGFHDNLEYNKAQVITQPTQVITQPLAQPSYYDRDRRMSYVLYDYQSPQYQPSYGQEFNAGFGISSQRPQILPNFYTNFEITRSSPPHRRSSATVLCTLLGCNNGCRSGDMKPSPLNLSLRQH